jgi:ankyrin repeat protein
MDVGRSVPRYEEIVLLYPGSIKLRSHLTEYYIVVVDLCRYLYNFMQKSAVQWFASSLDMSYLNSVQTELERWANSIKDQMTVNEAQESSGFRALTRGLLQSTAQQQMRATNLRVLNFCSTYNHETVWKQLRKIGNASFFDKQPEYRAWRDGSHPSTLLYRGRLGSGKSVLLANIVDDLSITTQKERPLVVYFFCRHDVPESLQARTIIGSIARQILRTVTDLSVIAQSCEDTPSTGDTEKVLDILLRGFSFSAKIYLVLDGLDECAVTDKVTLVPALQKIQEKMNISVCASFRDEPNNGLQAIAQQLLDAQIVCIPKNNPDIAAFIEADLERCLQQERLNIRDPTLISKIQDALLEGSQGMFLWVTLQIQSLCSMNTDHAIQEALSDLPKDLSETYVRVLHKSGGSEPALQAKILQLVLAAQRPLTTDELLEALSVTPGDATWDPSKVLNNIYSALGHCGCLLVTDEEEFTVRVVHRSVTQFLLNELDDAKHVKFSLDEAQRRLADIIVTYLGYGVFGTELSRAKVLPMAAQSAPSAIVKSTLGSSSVPRDLALKLLRARRQSKLDMSRVFAEVRGAVRSEPQLVFRFYDYAKKYWQDHIWHVSGNDAKIFNLSYKLIHDRAIEFSNLDCEGWKRFQRSAENGNASILALLIQTGRIATNTRDIYGYTPLLSAATNGYKHTVKILLDIGGVDVEAKRDGTGSSRLHTSLMMASEYGHKDTVELLLSSKADVEARNPDGQTSLIIAALKGHKDTVEALLSTADVEAKSKLGYTALMQAAVYGHTDIVELLINVGKADVDARDNIDYTPLMLAARSGHEEIVARLLGTADIEGKNITGWTPLIVAAAEGHTATVKLLLSKANVEARNDSEATALIEAARKGKTETVKVLLEVGKANVEARSDREATALTEAARNGKTETVKVLLEVGKANAEHEDDSGWTPLMYAEKNDDKEAAQVLRSYIDKQTRMSSGEN